MLTSNFLYPSTITQQVDPTTSIENIVWNNLENINIDNTAAVSSTTLYTIPGVWQERYISLTNQIVATNFNIIPQSSIITGIELNLVTKRESRVQDFVIQLCLNNELIGNNYGNLLATDSQIYGSSTDMWGTTLSTTDISDPTFGIIISFRSNETTPHRDLVYVSNIGLCIYYG